MNDQSRARKFAPDKYVAVPLDDEPVKDDEGTVLEPRLHRSQSWRLDIGFQEKGSDLGDVTFSMGSAAALALALTILKCLKEQGDFVQFSFDQEFDKSLY